MVKSRAAVTFVPNKPLRVIEMDMAPSQKGEVLVCIVVAGVCHTDVYTLSGQNSERVFPCTLDHEGGGIVEAVGEGMTSLQAGDHVIPLYTAGCDKYKFYLSGKTNLCQAMHAIQDKGPVPDDTSRLPRKGEPVFHHMGYSTFPEYTVLPEISLVKIFKDAPLERVCLLGCGITAGIGTVLNAVKVGEGATVTTFGLGDIGLATIIGAKMAKAVRIIAVDINPGRFGIARELGAADLISPKDYDKSIQGVIIELTGGGVDYSFECVGNMQLVCVTLEYCHKGWGELVVIGVAGASQEINTRSFQLATDRVWRGPAFSGVCGHSELPSYIEKAQKGEIPLDIFIIYVMGLRDTDEAFGLMHESENIRTVIHC